MSPPTDDPLAPLRPLQLSLPALEQQLAALLDQLDPPSPDGRVNARPDARTLRWYQSRGLIDKPLHYDGRQAIYGYRHIIAVLAIKLLQGSGLRLDQVQERLAGASFALLEGAVREALQRAGPAAPPGGLLPAPPGRAPLPAPAPATAPPAAPARALRAVELAPGVQLLIDPALVPDPDALIALLRAALTSGAPS